MHRWRERLSLFSAWFLGFILLLLGNPHLIISSLGVEKGVLLLFVLLGWGEYSGIFLIHGSFKEHRGLRDACTVVFLLGFFILWIWCWETQVGIFSMLLGSVLIASAFLKSTHLLLVRSKQPADSKRASQTSARVIDYFVVRPIGAVFAGLLFTALSFILSYMIVHPEPFFDVPTAFGIFYVVGSLDFGFFYFPRVREILLRGFIIHGGLTFGPFAMVYVLLFLLRIDVVFSVLVSPVFHAVFTLCIVREVVSREG